MGYVSRIIRAGGRFTSIVSAACTDCSLNACSNSALSVAMALTGSAGAQNSASLGTCWIETNRAEPMDGSAGVDKRNCVTADKHKIPSAMATAPASITVLALFLMTIISFQRTWTKASDYKLDIQPRILSGIWRQSDQFPSEYLRKIKCHDRISVAGWNHQFLMRFIQSDAIDVQACHLSHRDLPAGRNVTVVENAPNANRISCRAADNPALRRSRHLLAARDLGFGSSD